MTYYENFLKNYGEGLVREVLEHTARSDGVAIDEAASLEERWNVLMRKWPRESQRCAASR